MQNQIVLSAKTVASSSPAFKAELSDLLGFTLEPLPEPEEDAEDESELAALGLDAARAFLLGCSVKTSNVLSAIVDGDDPFSLRALEEEIGEGSLRGVWTGLTKRTRTITGDPKACLIDWGEPDEEGDYKGQLHPTTRNAFQKALEW